MTDDLSRRAQAHPGMCVYPGHVRLIPDAPVVAPPWFSLDATSSGTSEPKSVFSEEERFPPVEYHPPTWPVRTWVGEVAHERIELVHLEPGEAAPVFVLAADEAELLAAIESDRAARRRWWHRFTRRSNA